MSIFERKTANASRASQTVVVCTDGRGAKQRDRLLSEIAKAANTADGRVSKSPTKALRDELRALEESLEESLLSIEVVSLTPAKWSEIKRLCPPEKDAISRSMGFNVEKAVQAALVENSWAVDGEEREKLTKPQWQILFEDPEKAIGGGDWERLSLAVLTLNQASQSEAIARGKA